MTLRTTVRREDGELVRDIVSSTGFFRPDEIGIAVELVEERIRVGLASGYHFIFAERSGRVLGYSCYGPVPLTLHSYDIYWMAVRKEEQGAGIGRMLLERSEAAIENLHRNLIKGNVQRDTALLRALRIPGRGHTPGILLPR